MNKKWLILAIAGTLLAALTTVPQASEKAIIEAINSGDIELGSEVSLPDDASDEPGAAAAAPPVTRDTGAAEDLLHEITDVQVAAIANKAYPLMAAKWPFNVVFVCWERVDPREFDQRALVREAVASTWEMHSSLEFIGWEACTPQFKGVRIAVKDVVDDGPAVKYLGKFLAHDQSGIPRVVQNGMVLNFTFQHWGRSCQTNVNGCIRTIAVHEFGHAIGFAHEQNRPDTPGECTQPPQGPDGDTGPDGEIPHLTPWDPQSVMNYCNEKYNNDGQLSEFDIIAVQYVYGARN